MKLLFILLAFLILCPNLSQAQAPGSEYWGTRFAPCGLNDYVRSAVFLDGKYYVSGDFTEAQGKSISQPAVWDGNKWSTLDKGINGRIEDMDMFDRDLYICGQIDTGTGAFVNAIGRWNIDEAKWYFINLGNEFWTSAINHIEVDSQNIYFGSTTTNSIYGLCRWNIQEQKLYILPYMSITDMALSKNYLYVSSPGSVVAWDKKNEKMKEIDTVAGLLYVYGTGSSSISDITVGGDDSLFIAGNLRIGDSISASKEVALWDGVSWHRVGKGLTSVDHRVSLIYADGTLYAAGNITSDDDSSIKNFAVWKGSTWRTLDSSISRIQMQGSPLISVLNGSLFLYGGYNYMGSIYELIYDQPIVRWNGSNWITIDSGSCHGLNGPSQVVLEDGNDLIVCGNFLKAGGVPASNIAKWNGSNWESISKTPLASNDINYPISLSDIARFKGDIYVSGSSGTMYGTDTGISLARLDALGNWRNVINFQSFVQCFGANFYQINTIQEFQGELYVGGLLSNIYNGYSFRPFIGKLQGDSLVMLTSDTLYGRNKYEGNWTDQTAGVTSLVTDGVKLYIGGSFTHIGNIEYNCLAAWDGKKFSRLEENDRAGVTASEDYKLLVSGLLIKDSLLIITGYFDSISGISSRNLSLAQWDIKHSRWHEFALTSKLPSTELNSPVVYNGQVLFGALPNEHYIGNVPMALGVDGKVRLLAGGVVGLYPSGYESRVLGMTVTKNNTLVCVGPLLEAGEGVPSENFALYKAPPLSVKKEMLYSVKGYLSVNPNPVSDILTVRYQKSLPSHSTIDIIDALGRIVVSQVDESTIIGERVIQISLNALPSGVYQCVCTSATARYTTCLFVK